MALAQVHGLREVPSQPDAADAAAVARDVPCRGGAPGGRRQGDRPAGSPMISFVEGEVVEKSATRVVLNVGGVGYDLQVPTSVVGALPPIGRATRVHTRMVVRDDSMTLYGFTTPDERESVRPAHRRDRGRPEGGAVVPVGAHARRDPRAVMAGDADALTVVPGVGKKVAQRVVLDLRDRFGGEGELVVEGPLADVREALLALGVTPTEASEALAGVEADGRATDDLLREALQKVGA